MKYVPPMGKIFDQLTVIDVGPVKGKIQCVYCLCSCGKKVCVRVSDLTRWERTKRRRTLSCGCARSKSVSAGRRKAGLNTQHGLSQTKEYDIWRGMIRRCHDSKNAAFANYGARGIFVCDRWRRSFTAFVKDMGQRPEGCSLDRIDNNRGYELSNCRWASRREQNKNTRKNRYFTAFGKAQHLSAWAKEYNIELTTVRHRIDKLGYSMEQALTIPKRGSHAAN